jgi:uncharacterized protein YciI
VYVIYCLDRPGCQDLRATVRPRHLEYLEKYKDRIAVAGPILDDEKSAKGTMLIIDFQTQAEADRFLEEEPYRKEGLFEMVVARPWTRVMGKWLPQ